MRPKISCVCPTFGKTKHLNEAVQSFLVQDYENKELIIFNNYPNMDIEFDHPQVKVVNYKDDIYSIGACRNEGNKHATGDYICTWDDDDISLGKRLTSMMDIIEIMDYKGLTTNAWYSENNVIIKTINNFMSSMMAETQYLLDNPYPLVDDDDQYMWYKMLKEGVANTGSFDSPEYIYRWATGTYHVSGKNIPPQQQRQAMLTWASSIDLPAILQLTPYWERDYQKDVDEFNKGR